MEIPKRYIRIKKGMKDGNEQLMECKNILDAKISKTIFLKVA